MQKNSEHIAKAPRKKKAPRDATSIKHLISNNNTANPESGEAALAGEARSSLPFFISPHPGAPAFSKDSQLLLRHLLSEASSPRLATGNEEIRSLLRQAGLVSLFFFLKYIAGFNGPFNRLTEHLHLSVANARQMALEPGIKFACFMPRKHYKTTINTTGANAWEITRNPDLQIGLYHAVFEEALKFLHTTERIIDSNEFYAWLYPECVPSKAFKEKELIMPNRVRHHTEPTIQCGSVGGTSQGRHFDLVSLDDIIGEAQLNANRESNAEMYKTGHWLQGIERTLLVNWKTSRIILSATRYGPDDVYEPILNSAKRTWGYWDELDYKQNPKGKWTVYYRTVREKGKIIFPEVITEKGLEELQEDDPWTYALQYVNNPKIAGVTEMVEYPVRKFKMLYESDNWYILDWKGNKRSLDLFDVASGTDPAATEHYISAKTSRSSTTVWGMDSVGSVYLIGLQVGYVTIMKVFDWMFMYKRKFAKYLRATYLEANAGFKVLGPLLRKEQNERNEYLALRTVAATTDKVARIRTTLQPLASRGRINVLEDYYDTFMNEFQSFPQSTKRDILDASTLVLSKLIRPESSEEVVEGYIREQERFNNRTTNAVTGY